MLLLIALPIQATRFQEELDAIRAEAGFPGVTAAYILPHGTVGVAATGFADLEAKTPMTPHTRMLGASVGKTFVAATVLALFEEDLDQPISTWLKDRPWFSCLPNYDTITLRHLLTHSSGLPDHVYMEGMQLGASPEALVALLLDKPALFKPGEGWAYTDTGYILLGLIIESLSEKSYYEEVAERFLIPLHLDFTSPSDRRELPGLAAGYTTKDNRFGLPPKTTLAPGVLAWDPAIEWTGGGLVTTPRDLVIWAKALYEGNAMEMNYLKDLFQSIPAMNGVRYGAGVGIHENSPLGPKWGHNGWIPGYLSSMMYYPKYRIAVAFQINTDSGLSNEFLCKMENRLARVISEEVGFEPTVRD